MESVPPRHNLKKKCKHAWRIKVELFLDIPEELFHRLAKKRLRSREVRVEGANWPKSYAYCSKCGESHRGLGGGHP